TVHYRHCSLRGVEAEQGGRAAHHWTLSGRHSTARPRLGFPMIDTVSAGSAPPVCPECGAQVAPALLACPSCHRLVHVDELKHLAAAAAQAKQTGDASAELAAWRQALRSEEHTSELQSRFDLVCRLL